MPRQCINSYVIAIKSTFVASHNILKRNMDLQIGTWFIYFEKDNELNLQLQGVNSNIFSITGSQQHICKSLKKAWNPVQEKAKISGIHSVRDIAD